MTDLAYRTCTPGRRLRLVPLTIPLAAALLLGAWSAMRPQIDVLASRELASEGLVINEVDYDQPGTDTAEFVELRNVSAQGIQLADYDLLGINGGDMPATTYRRDHLPTFTLLPGQYFVVGAATVPSVDFVVGSTNIWQNGAPDAVALVLNTTDDPANDQLVDSVSYEGDTPGGPPNGGFWTETAGEIPGDNGASAYEGISRDPDGYDSDDNDADFAPRCITPGEPNTSRSAPCTGPGTATATVPAPTPSPADASPTPPASPTTTPPDPGSPTSPPDTTATPPPTPDQPTLVPPPATPPEPTAESTSSPPTPGATATEGSGPPLPSTTPLGPDPTPTAGPPTAVELAYFVAYRFAHRVDLRWRTLSEIDHAGFLVWRQSTAGDGRYITLSLIRPAAADGELAGASYAYVDCSPADSGATYWLDDVDRGGRITRHGPARTFPIRPVRRTTGSFPTPWPAALWQASGELP